MHCRLRPWHRLHDTLSSRLGARRRLGHNATNTTRQRRYPPPDDDAATSCTRCHGSCVPPTVTYLPYLVSGSTLTAVGRSQLLADPMAWNSLPDFIRDPTSSTGCVYLKRTCSRVTSACSAGFLTIMRYANPRTHSLTQRYRHASTWPTVRKYNVITIPGST